MFLPLALLEEVREGEWRLFVHLPRDEAELVAQVHGAHGKKAIFGLGAFRAVVEGNSTLGANLRSPQIENVIIAVSTAENIA